MRLKLENIKLNSNNEYIIDLLFLIATKSLENKNNIIKITSKDIKNLAIDSTNAKDLYSIILVNYVTNKEGVLLYSNIIDNIYFDFSFTNEITCIYVSIITKNFKLFYDEIVRIYSVEEVKFYFKLKSIFSKRLFEIIQLYKNMGAYEIQLEWEYLLDLLHLTNYANNNANRMINKAINELLNTRYKSNEKKIPYFKEIQTSKKKVANSNKTFIIKYQLINKNNINEYKEYDIDYIDKILEIYINQQIYTSINNSEYYRLFEYDISLKAFRGKKYNINPIKKHIDEEEYILKCKDSDINLQSVFNYISNNSYKIIQINKKIGYLNYYHEIIKID